MQLKVSNSLAPNPTIQKSIDNADSSHWLLFFISPFLASLSAIRNYKAKWAKNMIWAFIVFFGFTFGTAKELAGYTDIFGYTAEITNLYKKDLSFSEIKKMYRENKDIDILRLSIAIGVSRFTDSARILTALYGFIFGFFFSRNIWFVLDRLKGKIQPLTIILILSFFLIDPFWYINGFRFWTATHIFLYGLLPFIFEGKKKGIVVASLSFLVHFSFLLPISILLVFAVLGNRTILYFGFFLASIAISEINIKSFNAFIEARAPKDISERTLSYRKDSQVKQFRDAKGRYDETKTSIHAKWYLKALHWSLSAFLILFFFRRKLLGSMNPRLVRSLSFSLLFWGVANFMSSLPSGGRYVVVASLAAIPLVILCVHYQYKDKYFNGLMRVILPGLLLFIIVAFREGFYFLTLNTFIGNPIVALFLDYSFVLNDWIK
jgi:hypothetical protein